MAESKLTKPMRAARYFVVGYLSIGIALGSLLFATIPAMNVFGWGFYALTWPAFVCHGTKVCKGDGSYLVPDWAFTFRPTATGRL